MRTHINIDVRMSQQQIKTEPLLRLFEIIGVLARRRFQTAERHFSTLGLNHTEARLLILLVESGGASAQDALSNQLYIDRTNAGRALKRLEQGGYITRGKDETDKRANKVTITPVGREAVKDIAALRQAIAEEVLVGLSTQDLDNVADRLMKTLTPDERARL